MSRCLGCCALALVVSVAPVGAQERPSVQFGDTFRIDFRLKVHADERTFSPDLRREQRFDLRRLRGGVEGTVMKAVEYEVEYDFAEEDYPVRDAYLDVRIRRPLQVRGGKFKMPFSREAMTGAMNLDFAFRSRAADQLAPGRSIGGMVHGRLLDRRLQYQAGLFREDGENGRQPPGHADEGVPDDGEQRPPRPVAPMFAARTTMKLKAGPLKDVEVGGAMTRGSVAEGRHGVRGRMVFGGTVFPGLEVHGPRQRIGLEMTGRAGPVTLTGELMHIREERRGQGFDNEDLEATSARGWYVAGTWMAGRDSKPRFGGLELAARIEGVRFTGPTDGDVPSSSPRATAVIPNAERVHTFGVNWYVTQSIRLQGNVIRERLDHAVRAPIPHQAVYWSALLRLQFVL